MASILMEDADLYRVHLEGTNFCISHLNGVHMQ